MTKRLFWYTITDRIRSRTGNGVILSAVYARNLPAENNNCLNDKHCIAEGEKAISFTNGFFIGVEHGFS